MSIFSCVCLVQFSHSVMSNSVQPSRRQPTRLLHPRDFPGKSTGVGCQRLLCLHCWWECKLVQPLWRRLWRLLKKLEIELPYDPAIPHLGIHTKKTRIERDTCTPMFIAALFTIARSQKQPRCPSADEWIRELWYIYTMEYY